MKVCLKGALGEKLDFEVQQSETIDDIKVKLCLILMKEPEDVELFYERRKLQNSDYFSNFPQELTLFFKKVRFVSEKKQQSDPKKYLIEIGATQEMAEATLKHANGNLGRAIDYFLKHGAS
jgi:hypothetical protein